MRTCKRVLGVAVSSLALLCTSLPMSEAAISAWYYYDAGRRGIRVSATVQKPTDGFVYDDYGSGGCVVSYRTSHYAEVTKQSGQPGHQFQMVGECEMFDQVGQFWTYYPDEYFWKTMPSTTSGTWAAYQFWNPQNDTTGYEDLAPKTSQSYNRHMVQYETYCNDVDYFYQGTSIAGRIYFGCW